MALTTWFTAHPESEGESYGEHFRVAMGFSRQLLGAGLAAAVHAIMPSFHKTTASQRIHSLHHCLETGNREAITGLRAVPCPETLRKANRSAAVRAAHAALGASELERSGERSNRRVGAILDRFTMTE